MVGINNNSYVGPAPTFGGSGNTNYANTQTGPSSPFASGDKYSVESTSSAFDEAMAKLTGKSVLSPQNTQTTQAPPGVSQEELNWATALEQKVQSEKYTPNAQETAAYQAIAAKLSNAQKNPTQQTTPSAGGATQEEITWALAIEKKVKTENYTPNAQETAAYQAIAAKLAASKSQTTTTQPAAGATQQEIDWALALEQKVKTQNYAPNAQETAAYQAIAKKLQAGNTAQNTAKAVTQQEIDWALALEQKVKTQNYQATPQETAAYQDIAHRLQANKGAPNTTASSDAKDWAAWSQPFSVPKSLFQTAPRIIQVPSTLRSMVPTLPTYSVSNTGPNLTPANTPANNNQGAVNPNEINWALELEKKVKGGYNPNESELYQYKNIADRLQASKTASTPTTLPQNQGLPQQGTGTQPAKTGLGDRIKNAWNSLVK